MKLLIFPVLVILAPLVLGIGLSREDDHFPLAWVKGYLMELALLFLPAFICALRHTSLGTLVKVYLVILAAVSVGILVKRRSVLSAMIRHEAAAFRNITTQISRSKAAAVIGGFACALILVQAIIPVAAVHIDDDDATYVAMATVAVDTDSVYDYDPLRGDDLRAMTKDEFIEGEWGRYVISPLYAYYAVISALTGIRPAVLCHTAMPFFLTLMVYIIYAEIGRRLFRRKPVYTALFLILLSVIFMSSYSSVYTTGTFLLVRIWQGKAQFAGIAAPALILVFIDFIREAAVSWDNLGFLEGTLIASIVMAPHGGLFGILSVATAAAAMLLIRVMKDIRSLAAIAGTCVIPILIMAYYALYLS